MRILVVEDHKKIASLVIRGMQEAGFVVDNAEDGEDALHLALSASSDAAIMDVMLPSLTG